MPGNDLFLKQMRIRKARKGGPKWSILGFRSSEEVTSDPDVAELASFLEQMRIRNARKGRPKWSILGFQSSEEMRSGLGVTGTLSHLTLLVT